MKNKQIDVLGDPSFHRCQACGARMYGDWQPVMTMRYSNQAEPSTYYWCDECLESQPSQKSLSLNQAQTERFLRSSLSVDNAVHIAAEPMAGRSSLIVVLIVLLGSLSGYMVYGDARAVVFCAVLALGAAGLVRLRF